MTVPKTEATIDIDQDTGVFMEKILNSLKRPCLFFEKMTEE